MMITSTSTFALLLGQVQLRLHVVVDRAPEEDVEVVLPGNDMQPLAVAQVEQEQEETVSDLRDDARGKCIVPLFSIERTDHVDDREDSTVRCI
jgi:hypothetical protein